MSLCVAINEVCLQITGISFSAESALFIRVKFKLISLID